MAAAHPAGATDPASNLSALIDGETDEVVAASLAQVWHDDPGVRRRWHAYHLIGDALRSEELAGSGDDAAFLTSLRERLAREPVVLAPAMQAPKVASGVRRLAAIRRWAAPAAMAAGFVAVVGSLNVLQVPLSAGDGTVAAADASIGRAPLKAVGVLPASKLAVVSPPGQQEARTAEQSQETMLAIDGPAIRDARLDQYLAAHQQFGGSTALGLSSGFLRSATYDGPSAVAAGRR